MSYYSIKEDYIGDLTDMEPKQNLTNSWKFYASLVAAFIAGIGAGAGMFVI